MRAMIEEELIRRFVKTREERVFRQLYALHTPAVYGLIRRLAGPASDLAEDVMQEAWLRAASALPRFRAESSFRTWLTGIALNCYHERRRKLAAINETTDSVEPAVPAAAATFDVMEVLNGLSIDQREILVLHDVEG